MVGALTFLELEQKLTDNPLEGFTNPPQDMGALETAAYQLAIERHLDPRKKKVEWALNDAIVQELFKKADPEAVQRIKSEFGSEDGHFLVIPKDYDYSVHLNMVHYLLRSAGIKDDVMLAAAFSHDMMEDCRDDNGHLFRPDTLAAALKVKFLAISRINPCFHDEALPNEKIEKTVELVAHVTNPKLMPEGKRFFQVNKMRKSGEKEKQLKIADQAASIIEDVMVSSALDNKKLKVFLAKARDVVVACEDGVLPNKILRAVEDTAFRFSTQLLNISENYQVEGDEIETKKLHLRTAHELRLGFHLDEVLTEAKTNAHTLGLSDRRPFPNTELSERWGIGVGLKIENGHVQGIRIHAPKALKTTMMLQTQQLVDALETYGDVGMDTRTRVKSKMIHETTRPCIDLRLSPPVVVGDVANVLESVEAYLRMQHDKQQKDKIEKDNDAYVAEYRGLSFQNSCKELRQLKHFAEAILPSDVDVVFTTVEKSPWGERVLHAAQKKTGGAFDERDISR